jgi:hypothetical protein
MRAVVFVIFAGGEGVAETPVVVPAGGDVVFTAGW